jgi:hypothetical protein
MTMQGSLAGLPHMSMWRIKEDSIERFVKVGIVKMERKVSNE